MGNPTVFGAGYSVYVRAVCLVLEEKGVDYTLECVDIFAPDGPPPDYLTRHPFGRIPAFEHDGFRLYESGAISRYIDEQFPGPRLQPADAPGCARMNQILSIIDNYVYRTLVWDIFVERVRKPERGETIDEARIAAALPSAATCLEALEDLSGPGDFFVDNNLTLADLHAAPMFRYFLTSPEAGPLMAARARLKSWWNAVSGRASVQKVCAPMV